jgi:hypothetical protein
MSDDHETSPKQPEAPGKAAAEPGADRRGNSLQDASEEMVRFMEQEDEPGHAGRGDGG